jgi:hypothetical protein
VEDRPNWERGLSEMGAEEPVCPRFPFRANFRVADQPSTIVTSPACAALIEISPRVRLSLCAASTTEWCVRGKVPSWEVTDIERWSVLENIV